MTRNRRALALAIAAPLLIAACSDNAPPPSGIVILSGSDSAGQAGAALAAPLVVQVYDSTGHTVPAGTPVTFIGGRVDTAYSSFEAYVKSIAGVNFQPYVIVGTDAEGIARVDVQLGTAVGTDRVVITVDNPHAVDTAKFIAIVGPPYTISILPRDTALYAGASYVMHAHVVDSYGNPRTDHVTIVSADPNVTVTGDSTIHAGGTLGRYEIDVSGAGFVNIQANVSVVPAGELAAWRNDGNVVTMHLDGSAVVVRAPVTDGGIGVRPAWIPGTSDIIYAASNGTIEELRVVNTAGQVHNFFASLPPGFTHHASPAPTADGQQLFFVAWDTACAPEIYCLHRAHIDGTNVQMLPNDTGETRTPSPSPSGSDVVYMKSDVPISNGALHVLHVADTTIASWSLTGFEPHWSPGGTHIVFANTTLEGVQVVHPDGTNQQALGLSLHSWLLPHGWSSDGQWILVRDPIDGFLYLLDSSTGAPIKLPYTANLIQAALK